MRFIYRTQFMEGWVSHVRAVYRYCRLGRKAEVFEYLGRFYVFHNGLTLATRGVSHTGWVLLVRRLVHLS